ncbi:MAG: putative ATP-dependent helicase DinG [Pseudomonadota bacterium]
MSSYVDTVAKAFSWEGVLAQASHQFKPRAGQTDMAMAVAETIVSGGELVVEAGTGVGKTYAYLVPVLLSGQRALVSTATKALQDQLYSRDIPKLIDAFNLPIRVALLKGRGSYLCTQRLSQARQSHDASLRIHAHALSKIESWAQSTRTGDLAELSGLDDRSPVIPLVTSNRDNCLGSPCPQFKSCHVNLARKEAMAADVVVINHHLFFADLNVRETGMAELLPSVQTVVFDEAHQLNEIGINFLGRHLSTSQLLELTRDILGAGVQLARGLVDWNLICNILEKSTRDLRLTAQHARPGSRLRWADPVPDDIETAEWLTAMAQLEVALKAAQAGLDTVSEMAPDFVRLHERVSYQLSMLHEFQEPCAEGSVRWVEVGTQMRLVESPLDISRAVQTHMIQRQTPTAHETDLENPSSISEHPDLETTQTIATRRAWIFTSATLGEDSQMRWFTEPCGLNEARKLRVASPFDYELMSALYVPPGMPKPNDFAHTQRVSTWVEKYARKLGGRTLVLTTTLNAMRNIGEALTAALGHSGELEVLVQGQGPKRRLMERFREGSSHGGLGCVLVASASFWEGFDVPGDALQLVVIDKLPFPPPNDPLVEARSQRLELMGKSSFSDYSVPEAAVALKQGAGRLIRSETDTGVLVVCDPRLTGMAYGKRLLACLPPMRKITNENEFELALSQLTKISTSLPASDSQA